MCGRFKPEARALVGQGTEGRVHAAPAAAGAGWGRAPLPPPCATRWASMTPIPLLPPPSARCAALCTLRCVALWKLGRQDRPAPQSLRRAVGALWSARTRVGLKRRVLDMLLLRALCCAGGGAARADAQRAACGAEPAAGAQERVPDCGARAARQASCGLRWELPGLWAGCLRIGGWEAWL